MFQNVKKRATRRGFPISGYVGPNGGGKSAAMVWDTLPSLAAGRMVLSTVRLLDWTNPRECEGCDEPGHGAGHWAAHPAYVPFRDWQQLLDAARPDTPGCDILMDEVTGIASSRESHAMPAVVANVLTQLRRGDAVVRWSAPSWARADKIIRECSQGVTYCRGSFPVSVTEQDGERAWRSRRLFKWKTYDADDFEDFTAGKREQLSPIQVDLHWGPRSPVFSAYDTFDAVYSIGTVTDSGRCYRCGGRRSIPKCTCGEEPTGSRVEPRGPAEGGVSAFPAGVGGALRVIGATTTAQT